MSLAPARRTALAIARLLPRLFPPRQAEWARAMSAEIEAVEGDWRALRFAFGCLSTALIQTMTDPTDEQPSRSGATNMPRHDIPYRSGIACAVAATGLGLVYLALAGAGAVHIVVNAAALALGLVALGGLAAAGIATRASLLALPLGAALLATALFGASADGATRWVQLGPLGIQVSLVVLPFIVLAYARRPDAAGAAALLLSAAALALQPDRAMAGVLAASLAALALVRRDAVATALAALAASAFAVTLARPDPLPAVPFVDGILYSAFEVHWLAGAAVWGGAALLLVPALVGAWRDPGCRQIHFVFFALWGAIIGAAALGNYPTPVVGYGGSAILGYVLGLAILPGARRTEEVPQARFRPPGHDPERPSERTAVLHA